MRICIYWYLYFDFILTIIMNFCADELTFNTETLQILVGSHWDRTHDLGLIRQCFLYSNNLYLFGYLITIHSFIHPHLLNMDYMPINEDRQVFLSNVDYFWLRVKVFSDKQTKCEL